MFIKHNMQLCVSNDDVLMSIVAEGDAFCGKEWSASEINPPYTRLYYIIEGFGNIKTEKENLTLSSGNIYLIPTGFSFSHSCAEKMHQLYFHVTLKNPDGVDILRNTNRILCKKASSEHMSKILDLHKTSCVVGKALLKALLQTDIFSMLSDNGVNISNKNLTEYVKGAVDFISENLSATLSVKKVAESLAISTATLTHKFNEEMGISPGKYIDSMIMRHAEEMLVNSNLSLCEISGNLGFCDPFYFSRKFKENYGISPLKYRNIYK